MSAVPTIYARQQNFDTWQINNPSLQYTGLDFEYEYNDILRWAVSIQARLAEIQNDDGTIRTSGLDHDALTNFVANEHIDWTVDAATVDIHSGNIGSVPEGTVTAHEAALTILSSQLTETSTKKVMTDVERSKLAAVEASATADQTGAEIKTAYELEADTNAFTDVYKNKLGTIETGATQDQDASEIEANYNAQVAAASQAESEAGTEAAIRRFSPLRISQAIAALAAAGGSSTFESLTDTTVATPVATGEIIKWSGTAWINNTLAEAGIVATTDTRLTDSRTPLTHAHTLGDVTDSGTAAALNVSTGTTAASGEVVKGNDVRLSDTRTPTAHNHAASEITSGTLPPDRLGAASIDAMAEIHTNLKTGAHSKLCTGLAGTPGNLAVWGTFGDVQDGGVVPYVAPAVAKEIGLAVSNEASNLVASTTTAALTFRMPYAMTLTAVRASVTTAPTGSTIEVDINEAGASVLSTYLSIDINDKTSVGATSTAVISDSALADDAEITVYIRQAGSTIPGTGLKLWLIGTLA